MCSYSSGNIRLSTRFVLSLKSIIFPPVFTASPGLYRNSKALVLQSFFDESSFAQHAVNEIISQGAKNLSPDLFFYFAARGQKAADADLGLNDRPCFSRPSEFNQDCLKALPKENENDH